MKELNCTDLTQPFQNVRVGVDILSELQEKLKGTVPAEQLPYDVLAAYNYGLRGAQKNLWAMGCMSTNTTEPFWKGRRN